jgi:hypothetical protein
VSDGTHLVKKSFLPRISETHIGMAWSLQRTTFADPDITRKTKLSNSLTSFLGSCFAEASSRSVRSAPSRTSNSNPGCIGKSGSSCSSNRSIRSCEDIPCSALMEGSRRRVTGEVRGSIVMVNSFRFVSEDYYAFVRLNRTRK